MTDSILAGGRWKVLNPPTEDSVGRSYDCTSTVGLGLTSSSRFTDRPIAEMRSTNPRVH